MKNEFNLKPQPIEKLKINTNRRDDMEINDSNFLQMVGEKVNYIQENYFIKKKEIPISLTMVRLL